MWRRPTARIVGVVEIATFHGGECRFAWSEEHQQFDVSTLAGFEAVRSIPDRLEFIVVVNPRLFVRYGFKLDPIDDRFWHEIALPCPVEQLFQPGMAQTRSRIFAL